MLPSMSVIRDCQQSLGIVDNLQIHQELLGIPDILASVGQNSLLSLVNVNNFLIDNEIVRNRGVNELLDLFSISIKDEEHFSCTSTNKCSIPKNYQTFTERTPLGLCITLKYKSSLSYNYFFIHVRSMWYTLLLSYHS